MSDLVEAEGEVVNVLPNNMFKVKLDNGPEILAYLSGRIRKYMIRIVLGDRVRVEMWSRDLTKGRITYRDR